MTNLTDANMNLENQVADKANHMATNDAAIETMKKVVQKLQWDIKTPTTRKSGQSTKKTGSSVLKKGIWRNSPYFWTHGLVGNQGVDYRQKAEGHR